MSTLECQSVTIKINDKLICENFTIQIKPGQVWGILGRNGVGKTTLLHSLAGLRSPAKGEILLNNNNLLSLSRKQIAQKIGLLLQHTEDAFPSSVLETVLSGRHPHIEQWQWESAEDLKIAQQALHTVQLTSLSERNVDQLSGGERQRVSIACLLAQSPDIYLLDEPNSHLDLKYQIELLQHIVRHCQNNNNSIVMSLHDINLAQYFCSHLIFLFEDGSFRTGSKQELLTPEVLSELYQYPLEIMNGTAGELFFPKKPI